MLENAFCEKESNSLEIDGINHVFTKDDEKPHKRTLNSLSNKIYKILNTTESYKILVLDILKYFFTLEFKDVVVFKKKYEYRVKNIIENAFADNIDDKDMRSVKTIYTLTNKKPNKRLIETISKKTSKQCINLFIKIKKI